MGGTRVVESEENNGDGTALSEGGDLTEIEVECQQDPGFACSLLTNRAIRESDSLKGGH
jgi:hypothetical protein